MTDRPVLMSAPMVRALLREIEQPGTGKTMTRRPAWRRDNTDQGWLPTIWQKVRPGDRIVVREKWWAVEIEGGGIGNQFLVYDDEWSTGPGATCPEPVECRPTIKTHRWGAHPSIHMYREYSRITLVVTATRMERVREISEADARAEGMGEPYLGDGDPPFEECAVMVSRRMQFRNLWKTLHPKPPHRWEDDPECVAVTFVPHLCNVDAMAEAA